MTKELKAPELPERIWIPKTVLERRANNGVGSFFYMPADGDIEYAPVRADVRDYNAAIAAASKLEIKNFNWMVREPQNEYSARESAAYNRAISDVVAALEAARDCVTPPPTVTPQDATKARRMYSELIHIAAALATGKDHLSPYPDDYPSEQVPLKEVITTARKQEAVMKDWAYRVRQVANYISATMLTPSPVEEQK